MHLFFRYQSKIYTRSFACRAFAVNHLALWHLTCFVSGSLNPGAGAYIMAESKEQHWRALCAAAAQEPDSEKVALLVDQILEALDEPRDIIRTDQPSQSRRSKYAAPETAGSLGSPVDHSRIL
jgi:hypothetical protein